MPAAPAAAPVPAPGQHDWRMAPGVGMVPAERRMRDEESVATAEPDHAVAGVPGLSGSTTSN